ncbi:tyrosine-type recombinase/integrase [Corynebacterium atrinae]|uniref:tyrosine-type recombinase/integrase n=1 Tax=Corynebacterium atrinae TaxID=1336740 RepID=UPI0025B2AF54|nr:tyrosine-type recombinase/integrase [Corynebacterium atrinae]
MSTQTDTVTTGDMIDVCDRYRWQTGSRVVTVSDAARWYLAVCQGRRMSEHTIRAYRGGLNRIGQLLAGITGHPVDTLPLEVVNRNDLGDAFNEYAATRSPASQKQAWAVWNGMCRLLVDHEVIARNPMGQVPSGELPAVTLAKTLPTEAVEALLKRLAEGDAGRAADAGTEVGGADSHHPHPRRWWERDHAMVLVTLVTAVRASELCGITFGDITSPYADDGARQVVIRGKGHKERKLTLEAPAVEVMEKYLRSRSERVNDERGMGYGDDLWNRWAPEQELFVQVDGGPVTPAMFHQRLEYAYRAAEITAHRAPGALSHQLRQTVATMLADDPSVTPHGLKTFLGHSSLSSAERYILDVGRATGQRNPIYGMMGDISGLE